MALLALLPFVAPAASEAQEGLAPDRPSVTVTARGEVELEPDYAMIVFGADAYDETAEAAAAEMDRVLMAMADTLATLGFPADRLPNADFRVRPRRAGGARPGIAGYDANASVRVEVHELERLPTIIGAVLTAGATTVTGLSFHASGEAEARGLALERAVTAARADAERLAAAAGARLGPLLEIESGGDRPRVVGAVSSIRLQGMTIEQPITPRSITVSAAATVRWALIEGR